MLVEYTNIYIYTFVICRVEMQVTFLDEALNEPPEFKSRGRTNNPHGR